MKMTSVGTVKKYHSSDRAHIQLPKRLFTKAERAEWVQDILDSCERGRGYLAKGDRRSALSVVLHIHGLRSFGITTPEGIDFTSAFYAAIA